MTTVDSFPVSKHIESWQRHSTWSLTVGYAIRSFKSAVLLFGWSRVLFGFIVFISIFFPDEITAIHESRWREPASAVIGISLAIVVYFFMQRKSN